MVAAKTKFFSALLVFSFLLTAASTAFAGEVVITPFYPRAEFQTERGYFRTEDGRYYHYDHDRDGWHYGRNHREGERWEKRHHHN